jgi:hypothetical protein
MWETVRRPGNPALDFALIYHERQHLLSLCSYFNEISAAPYHFAHPVEISLRNKGRRAYSSQAIPANNSIYFNYLVQNETSPHPVDYFRPCLERNLPVSLVRKEGHMRGIIQIVSGLVIGGAGFTQIAAHPIPGICVLFLAGFVMMTGFEKTLSQGREENGD